MPTKASMQRYVCPVVGDIVRVKSAFIDRDLVGKILPVIKVDGFSVWLEGSTACWQVHENGKDQLELVNKNYTTLLLKDWGFADTVAELSSRWNMGINTMGTAPGHVLIDELSDYNPKTKKMDIITKFLDSKLNPPKKAFKKAGIINSDGVITTDGLKVFLTWLLLDVHAEKFNTEVVADLLKKDQE